MTELPMTVFALFAEYNTTDDGWLLYNDSQYYLNMNKQSMEAARAYCKKNFGELVVITGESERKFLWKQARNLEYISKPDKSNQDLCAFCLNSKIHRVSFSFSF